MERSNSTSSSNAGVPDLVTTLPDSIVSSAGPSTPHDAQFTIPVQKTSVPASQLQHLLQMSALHAQFVGKQLQDAEQRRLDAIERSKKREESKLRAEAADKVIVASTRSSRSVVGGTSGGANKPSLKKVTAVGGGTTKKRTRDQTTDREIDVDAYARAAKAKSLEDDEDGVFVQSPSVSGTVLKDYQLAGVHWLVALYESGVNGILADEMGLGKTLQTIAFIAHLRDKGVLGPHLIIAPVSVLKSWESEFNKFAPTIPVVVYHGTPAERAQIRSERLGLTGQAGRKKKGRKSANASASTGTINDVDADFPIIITSYDLIINDRPLLSKLAFKIIVTDEAHRLKNKDAKLVTELKCYQTANKLLLTGTPLQNNLEELWSLLSYLMPELFSSLKNFQDWFDLSSFTSGTSGSGTGGFGSNTTSIVTQLHGILQPMMLRRLKSEVEQNLPLKKEYVLSAPLTAEQKALYDAALAGDIRGYLIRQQTALMNGGVEEIVPDSDDEVIIVEPTSASKGKGKAKAKVHEKTVVLPPRKRVRKSYVEQDDDEFFEGLNDESLFAEEEGDSSSMAIQGMEYAKAKIASDVNKKTLLNVMMQLRKVCNHPYLFDWPIDPMTGFSVVNDKLLAASGKMLLLDRLLAGLFAKGHKVLLFSQFTSQLDLIHAWAEERKGWEVYRIDGSTKIDDRKRQMDAFNSDKGPDAINLFLLSTRAGGVGVTLTGADTVIIFDSDWNPQQDLQAQDRAHRIGQTKPVLVFRLCTADTVESKLLERAAGKQKLAKILVDQGNLRMDESAFANSTSRRSGVMSEADLLASIQETASKIRLVQEGDVILSDEQLERFLDRSDAVMRSKAVVVGEAVSAIVAEEIVERDELEDGNGNGDQFLID